MFYHTGWGSCMFLVPGLHMCLISWMAIGLGLLYSTTLRICTAPGQETLWYRLLPRETDAVKST